MQLELHQHPSLAKRWRALERREAKLEKAAESSGTPYVPLSHRPDATFLPSLLDEFLEVRHCVWLCCVCGSLGCGQSLKRMLLCGVVCSELGYGMH